MPFVCNSHRRALVITEGADSMQMRFLFPTVGGIFGILYARGQQATGLETFGYMLLGLVVGWGIYWITSRNSRKGGT